MTDYLPSQSSQGYTNYQSKCIINEVKYHDGASGRLEVLRQQINDEEYLNAAIKRLALVLSNELMGLYKEGGRNERKRRK